MPEKTTGPGRYVKLFRNGRNQAVRIPREFEFSGVGAIMRQEGKTLILDPAPARSLLAVLSTLVPFEEELPAPLDLPPEPGDI